jgi:hypothetical protein
MSAIIGLVIALMKHISAIICLVIAPMSPMIERVRAHDRGHEPREPGRVATWRRP